MTRDGPAHRDRPLRALAAALLLVCVPCARASAGGGWREVAPLPERRWFHVAATDGDGRLHAFAGKVWPEGGRRTYGLKDMALRIYDPEEDSWRAGPSVSSLRAVNRITTRSFPPGDITSDPVRVGVDHREYTIPLEHEVPPGTGGRDGRIYWLGGPSPAIYDPEQDAWVQDERPRSDNDLARLGEFSWLTSAPRLIRQGAVTAAAPDGKIYLVGGLGHPRARAERSSDPQNLYALLDSVDAYDPATRTWEERAPLRRARQLAAGAFGADGRLYVFGGYGHKGVVRPQNHPSEAAFRRAVAEMKALGRRALRSVEIYDPATDTWSAGAPMPAGRHAMGAALGADGRIYVVGGAVSYSEPRPEEEVFVYDPAADAWSEGPELRHGRYHHAVAGTRDGRIYAVGGIARMGWRKIAYTASVEVLDTAPPAPAPRPAAPDRGC